MATIANLMVKIGADVSQFERGTASVTRSTQRMARQIEATDTPFRRLQSSTRSLADAFLPVSIGAGLVAFGLRRVFQAADEYDASLRTLASTAAITGQNLGFLQQTAKDTQSAFRLSTAAANNLTIEVVKLTSKAGQIDQTRAALQAFLDLGAGRGMGAQQTLEALRQAILGIDEGTDKLFNANPIVLYQQYADSIGTSVGKLTDAQKAQALLTAALISGGKVAGEYARYLQGPQGQADQLRTKTEQAAAGIGQALNGLRSIAVQTLSLTFVPVIKGVAEYVPKAALVIARAFTYIPEGIARAIGASLQKLGEFEQMLDEFVFRLTRGRINVSQEWAVDVQFKGRDIERRADEFRARVEKNFRRKMKDITDTVNLTMPVTGDTSALDRLLNPPPGTSGTLTALEQQGNLVDRVAEAYEGLTARQEDATGALRLAIELHEQIEASLQRQVDPLSEQANALRRQAETLKEIVALYEKTKTVRASLANQPLVTTPPNLTTVPTALPTPPAEAAAASGGFLSKLLGGTVGQIVAQLGPLAIAAAALRPVFEGIKDVIGPAVEALEEPLRVVGQVIGDALVPILSALEGPLEVVANLLTTLMIPVQALVEILTTALQPAFWLLSQVVRGITFVLSYFYEAIGYGVRTIGHLIDALPFVSGGPIIRAGQEMIDGARSARRGLEDLRGTAERLNEAMVNVVQGFKVEQYRFPATGATLISGTPISPPPGRNPGGVGGGSTVNVNVTAGGGGSADRKATYRAFYEQFDQQSRSNPAARELFLSFPAPALS